MKTTFTCFQIFLFLGNGTIASTSTLADTLNKVEFDQNKAGTHLYQILFFYSVAKYINIIKVQIRQSFSFFRGCYFPNCVSSDKRQGRTESQIRRRLSKRVENT